MYNAVPRHNMRHTLPALQRLLDAAIYLFACILLTGCSQQENRANPEKVSIALTTTTDSALVQIALNQGYFSSEGLEVEARPHAYGKLAFQDMLDGRAEFATVAETPLAFAVLDGADIAVVAMIQSAQRGNAIVARRDRGIRALRDLRGKTVAVSPGTTMDYYLDVMLALEGMDRGEVKVVDVQGHRMPAALAKGEVDAVSALDVYVLAASEALERNAVVFQDDNSYTNMFVLAAPRNTVREHPGRVQKILRALIRAQEFARKQPEAAQAAVADYCGIDLAIVRRLWPGQRYAVSLDQTLLLALEEEAAWAMRNGRTKAVQAPGFLHHIHLDGLGEVAPSAVNILK